VVKLTFFRPCDLGRLLDTSPTRLIPALSTEFVLDRSRLDVESSDRDTNGTETSHYESEPAGMVSVFDVVFVSAALIVCAMLLLGTAIPWIH
jgi:hypothetical protein